MANELKHKAVGTVLTQVEFEATDSHALNSQATGDIIYASSTTQLSRLAKDSDNTILTLSSNIPAWTATPTLTTVDATTDFTVGTTVITDDVITFTPTTNDTVTMTAATNGAFSLVTVDTAAAAANIQITADGTVDIDSTGALTLDSGAAINIEPASGSVILLDGVLTVDAGVVAPVATAHDTAGTAISISAGDTTAGTTNNIAGGALTIQAGRGKGSGAGGDIIFQTANAGGSGSSINALATAVTISDDLSTTFAGIVSVDATTESTSTVTGSIHTDGGLGVAGDVILGTTSTIFIGDTANANMTAGITLNQGSADDEIFALKSSDVGHGMTALAETDSYFVIRKNRVDGGTELRSLHGVNNADSLFVRAASAIANTTRSTSAVAPIHLWGAIKSGTSDTSVGANGNLVVVSDRGTVRFIFDADGTMYSIGATYTDSIGDGAWYINETANGNSTVGLTINMGAADDKILTLKSSDVSHAMTSNEEADTFGTFSKSQATSGGLNIQGYKDADGSKGFAYYVSARLGEAADTTKSTSGVGVIYWDAAVTDGSTNVAAAGSEGNLAVLANNGTTRFIFDAEGDSHQDVGTAWTNFDDYDDLELVRDIRNVVTRVDDPLRQGFVGSIEASRAMLDAMPGKPIVTFNADGHHFLNTSRLAMLHHGAILQIGNRIAALETENRELKALIGGQ